MSLANFQTVTALTAISISDPIDVSHLESWDALLGGTFVGTASIEVSFDGVAFVAHPDGAAKSAPIIVPGGMRAKQVRLNCTAFTSGSLEFHVSGSDTDNRG